MRGKLERRGHGIGLDAFTGTGKAQLFFRGGLDVDRVRTQAQQAGQVIPVGEDLPKSFLLCRDKGGKVKVYLSQLSTATLLKRMELGSLTI